MKRFFVFLLSLTIAYFPSLTFAYSRSQDVVNSALTDHANTAMRAPTVSNGMVNTSVTQRVALGGSAAEITTPFGFAADYAAVARSAAGLAGKIAGGYVAVEGAKWAVQKLLDGVGYVMDPVAQSIKQPITSCSYTDPSCTAVQYQYLIDFSSSYFSLKYCFSTSDCASAMTDLSRQVANSQYGNVNNAVQYTSCAFSGNDILCNGRNIKYGNQTSSRASRVTNPNYSTTPAYTTKTPQQVQDAFLTWMQNNPTNVTDPIVQNMYTPAQTTGWNLTGAEGAHYGNDGLTDEMVNNILANRNAALSNPNISTIKDSAAPATPDSTSTTTLPDGTTKTTQNRSYTNTDGVKTTTTTTTTTKPDGTTSTESTTSTTQAQEAPAFCDYFSTLCDWIGWTKQEPVNDTDTAVDAQKPSEFDTSVFSTNRFQVSRQCPVPEQHTLTLSGISTNFAFDLSPLCSVLDLARPALVACSFLYAAYIVIGAARNG